MNTKTETENKEKKDNEPPMTAKEEWAELIKAGLLAFILAMIVRSFLYEPFHIPSSSMKPTLEIGDYLFVFKPEYGYSRYSFPLGIVPLPPERVMFSPPERGDVVVFKLPTNPSIDYIKRIIGLPGDTVQVKNGRLYINGKQVKRTEKEVKYIDERGVSVKMIEYIEELPNGVSHLIYEESDRERLDNTPEYKVPEGHYFVMGDNRDNSQDSRVKSLVGFVPVENLVGKADRLFFSTNGTAGLAQPWKWHKTVRYDRLFMKIHDEPISDK